MTDNVEIVLSSGNPVMFLHYTDNRQLSQNYMSTYDVPFVNIACKKGKINKLKKIELTIECTLINQ
jgi:hypothetical protein